MCVTILWDDPQPLPLSRLHLVSKEKIKGFKSISAANGHWTPFFVNTFALSYMCFFSPDQAETKIPELHLGFNQHRYSVTLGTITFSRSLQ